MFSNCFIICPDYCYIPFLSYWTSRRRQTVTERKYRMSYSTGSKKHVGAKPGGAAFTDRLSYSSIRHLVPLTQMKLVNIQHDKSEYYSSLLMSLKWQQLSSGSHGHSARQCIIISSSNVCPDQTFFFFYQRFFSLVMKTTCTLKHRHPASAVMSPLLLCCPTRIIKIRHRPKHTLVVSNQINCSWLKSSLCLGPNLTHE